MKDIARLPVSTTGHASSAGAMNLTSPPSPGGVTDPAASAGDHGIRLPWRRLDRLASAATLEVVLVSPRTALLIEQMLGPRIPHQVTARPIQRSVSRRREMGR